MGIMDDIKRNDYLDNMPDLTRWGVTDFPSNPKGYATKAEELDGIKFNPMLKGDFAIQGVQMFENEDGTTRLSLRLAGHDPGPSQGDQFRVTFWLRPDELENPEGFMQERSLKAFGQLTKFVAKNELVPEGWNPDDYVTAVRDVATAMQNAQGWIINGAFGVSQYVKDGDLKGPYLNVLSIRPESVDKGTDTPF